MGLTLDYYKNINGVELREMNTDQLKRTLQQIAMHTNSRISQLKKQNLEKISRGASSLLLYYPQGLSGKGITDRNTLIKRIVAGQTFLKGTTSTVSGTRKMMRKLLKLVGEEEIASDEMVENYLRKFGSDFWEIYRKLAEESGSYKEDSEGLIQSISDVMEENNKVDISEMIDKARERYHNNEIGEDIEFESSEDLAQIYRRRK